MGLRTREQTLEMQVAALRSEIRQLQEWQTRRFNELLHTVNANYHMLAELRRSQVHPLQVQQEPYVPISQAR